jgi:signal transduction histidine kinase
LAKRQGALPLPGFLRRAPAVPAVAARPAPGARRRRGVSLRYKLFLALLVTTLLPYSAASWAVYDRIEAGARDQMLTQAQSTGKLAEALYEQRGLALESAAKTVALSNEVILATFYKDLSKLVDALVPLETRLAVTNITVTDRYGDVLMRSNDPQNWGDNISNRMAAVRTALEGRASWGSEVDNPGGLVLRGAHPIHYGFLLIGTVLITERITPEIVDQAEQKTGSQSTLFSFEGQSTPFLADVQGNVLVGPDLPSAVVRQVLDDRRARNFLADVNGRAIGGYAWPLYDADRALVGAIAVVTSLSAIEQTQDSVLRLFTLLGLAVLLTDVLIAWLLSRALINPLRRLTLAAAQIAGGDYRQPVVVRTHDEIGSLGDALDQMRERVGAANSALVAEMAQSESERNVVNAVLDSTRDGIVMFDAAGRFVVANERWEALFGLSRRVVAGAPAERVLRQIAPLAADPDRFAGRMRELLERSDGDPEPAAPGIPPADASLPAASAGVPTFEFARPQKRSLRCYSAPVRDREGGVIGRLLVFQDITKERTSEELKAALVSTVTHELRTPLAAIKGYARTLLIENADWDEATRREFLTTIAEESDRLGELVDNLLETSKIEAGALQVARQPVFLGPIVERVAARHRAHDPDHPIEVRLAPGLPVVDADPRRVEQVLRNLIENAQKYSPTGNPITIAAEVARPNGRRTKDASRRSSSPASGPTDGRQDPKQLSSFVLRPSSEVRVTVADAGIGIPPEHLEHIFERFYRVDNSLVRRAGGTGLGLTISRGIVEAHGGRIWAESAPGQGSRFHFTLLVADDGRRTTSRPSSAWSAPTSSGSATPSSPPPAAPRRSKRFRPPSPSS